MAKGKKYKYKEITFSRHPSKSQLKQGIEVVHQVVHQVVPEVVPSVGDNITALCILRGAN